MATILIGDIGGTNSRLQLVKLTTLNSEVVKAETFPSQNFPSILEIIEEFLREQPQPKIAVLGIAGAIDNNIFNITNVSWPPTSTIEIEQRFSIIHVKFLNDFEAAGYGVLELLDEELIPINPKALTDPEAPKAVIGPGTGLGECFLTPIGEGLYKVWPSEGGHCDFGPKTDLEWRYANYIM